MLLCGSAEAVVAVGQSAMLSSPARAFAASTQRRVERRRPPALPSFCLAGTPSHLSAASPPPISARTPLFDLAHDARGPQQQPSRPLGDIPQHHFGLQSPVRAGLASKPLASLLSPNDRADLGLIAHSPREAMKTYFPNGYVRVLPLCCLA